MDPLFSVSTTFRVNNYIKCFKKIVPYTIKWYEILAMASLFLCSFYELLVGLLYDDVTSLWWALGVMIFACLILGVAVILMAVVWPRRTKRFVTAEVVERYGGTEHQRVLHFYPWGILSKSAKEENRWNYSEFRRIIETEEFVILHCGGNLFLYIDRRDIPNYADFRQFMQDRLRDGGMKSYRPDNGAPL